MAEAPEGYIATNPDTGEKLIKRGGEWQPYEGQQDQGGGLGEAALGTARSALEGASFGWSDEIGLLAAAAAAKATGAEEPFGDIYQQMQEGYRERQGEFREEHPVLSTTAEIGGGLATGGGAAAGVRKALPGAAKAIAKVPGLLRYPAAGAGGGAVGGAGFAAPGERQGGAVRGALLGAGTAGALGATRPIASAIARRRPGQQSTRAYRRLATELRREGLTPKQIGARLRRLGDDSMIADVGGPNVLDLAETVGQQPGPGRRMAVRRLAGREQRQPQKLARAAGEAVEGAEDFYDEAERLIAKRAEQAQPLYEQAYQKPVRMTEKMQAIMERPAVKRALRQGQRMAADEGGVTGGNIQTVDYTKRALDDMIETAKRQGNKQRARALTRTKREMLDVVDEQVPEYKAARQAFESPSRAIDLMERGRNFMKEDPRLLARELADMSESDAQFYRTGLYRGLLDMVENFGANRDPKFLLNKPAVRNKVKAAFGEDSSGFRRFMQRVQAESQKKRTRSTVLGNSATARRLAKQEDVGFDPNLAVDVATGSPTTATANFMRQAINMLRKKGMSEKQSAELGRLLFTTDRKAQEEILEKLSSSQFQIPQGIPGLSVGAASESAALTTPR